MTTIIFMMLAALLCGAAFHFLKIGVWKGVATGSLLVLAANSVTIIPPEHAGVKVLFGKIDHQVKLPEGIHLVNPFADIGKFSLRREIIEMGSSGTAEQSDNSSLALSSDRTPLTIDVVFPYRLRAPKISRVFHVFGTHERMKKEMLIPAARNAIRDAVKEFTWQEAATSRREEVALAAKQKFAANLMTEVTALKIGVESLGDILEVLNPQLRKVLPPEKITEAVSDKLAALEEEKKQATLTRIATEIASRRTQEGLGISNLFDSLPEGFAPSEISMILMAMAEKQRSDAMEKAVNMGQVKMFITQGNVPLSIPSE